MFRLKHVGVMLLVLVGTVVGVAAATGASSAPRAAIMPATTSHGVSIVNQGGSCVVVFCFEPGTITVRQVQTVTWTNHTSVDHTVTRCTTSACPGAGPGTGGDPAFGSSDIAPGGTFSVTFHKVGTYIYYCMIHGYALMHGTITVLPFAVATTKLPGGTVGKPYKTTLAAAGGKAPLHWSVVAGALPSGLTLSSAGVVSGTPKTKGTFKFTVRVLDSSSPALMSKAATQIVVA